VTRIQEAAGGLDERVAELTAQLDAYARTRAELQELTRSKTEPAADTDQPQDEVTQPMTLGAPA